MEEKHEINEIHIHNDINHINTQKLNENDLDVFFTICAMFKNSNNLSIRMPFDKFLRLAGIEKSTLNTRKKFIDFAARKTKKLRDLEYFNKTEYSFQAYHLIEGIEVPPDEDYLEFTITTKFAERLHDYTGNFTDLYLQAIVGTQGKYAKNLYHLLMQYDDTGYATFRLDEFRGCMGIPDTYRTKDIKPKVIKPAVDILLERKLFEEITFDANQAHRQGNAITGFDFHFKVAATDEDPGQQKFKINKDNEVTYQNQPRIYQKQNRFNNFEQHNYDFEELERRLLDN